MQTLLHRFLPQGVSERLGTAEVSRTTLASAKEHIPLKVKRISPTANKNGCI